MPSLDERIKTCFISAPVDANTTVIRGSLQARGIRIFGDESIYFGTPLVDQINQALQNADLVVGGNRSQRRGELRANVLLELGMALALDKRLLVFTLPNGDFLRTELQRIQLVRAGLENRSAIDFALDQILRGSGPTSSKGAPPYRRRSETLL